MANAAANRPLGYRGAQVLRFVRHYRAEHGVSPSYGTICEELDICNKGTLLRIVARLERRGLIRRSVSPGYKKPVLVLPR